MRFGLDPDGLGNFLVRVIFYFPQTRAALPWPGGLASWSLTPSSTQEVKRMEKIIVEYNGNDRTIEFI